MRILLLYAGLFLSVVSCSPQLQQKVSKAEITTIDSVQISETDSGAFRILSPYRDTMMALMNGFLVRNEKVMTKGIPESELGNFVSDLVFQAAKDFSRESGLDSADFCLLNNGGFRSSLPTGDILLRHVYELMPFDNEIVVIEISSAATDSLFRYIRGRKGAPVSGLKLVLNDAAWESAVIGGSAFNDSSTYHVVTSDYLASGGDGAGFFLNPLSVSSTGIKIRDAIIQHMKSIHSSGKSISAANDGRISFH